MFRLSSKANEKAACWSSSETAFDFVALDGAVERHAANELCGPHDLSRTRTTNWAEFLECARKRRERDALESIRRINNVLSQDFHHIALNTTRECQQISKTTNTILVTIPILMFCTFFIFFVFIFWFVLNEFYFD